jgi:hypothetical protein
MGCWQQRQTTEVGENTLSRGFLRRDWVSRGRGGSSITNRTTAIPREGLSDQSGGIIKLCTRALRVVRTQPQPEPVPLIARKNVQVHVEDILHRGLAVSKEEIHPLAAKPSSAKSRREPMSNTHEVGGHFCIEVRHKRGVFVRDNQHVSWIDRLDVHEDSASVVAVDEAGRFAAVE